MSSNTTMGLSLPSSNMQIINPGHGSIDGSKFHDPKYWDPAQYRAWHDDFWENVRDGTVMVGEPEKLDGLKQAEPASKTQEKPR